MEVWTLSVEANAAVFMGVFYGHTRSVGTLIRPNRTHTKDLYHLLVSARRHACGGGNWLQICVAFCA